MWETSLGVENNERFVNQFNELFISESSQNALNEYFSNKKGPVLHCKFLLWSFPFLKGSCVPSPSRVEATGWGGVSYPAVALNNASVQVGPPSKPYTSSITLGTDGDMSLLIGLLVVLVTLIAPSRPQGI